MATTYVSSWSEEAWNAVLGPYTTPQMVLEDAAHADMTPQDWINGACDQAINALGTKGMGLSEDFVAALRAGEVFGDLCRQCGVAAS